LPTCSKCADSELGNFELARLADVANLREELHAALDRVIDAQSLAVLAAWLRTVDRQELKRQLLQSPDAKIKGILAQAKELIRDGQKSDKELNAGPMPSNWNVRPCLPPGKAHIAASLRYAERNMAEGKCSICPKPLAHHSVRYCDRHLEIHRQKDERYLQKKGIRIGAHGRQPGTLANLALQREKRKRA